ncbi:MAG: hypothetical protein K940chlam7_02046, partial [Chlamydiae bacterium]|nr:hypothetical protein [Chlamydiota bacterium]
MVSRIHSQEKIPKILVFGKMVSPKILEVRNPEIEPTKQLVIPIMTEYQISSLHKSAAPAGTKYHINPKPRPTCLGRKL